MLYVSFSCHCCASTNKKHLFFLRLYKLVCNLYNLNIKSHTKKNLKNRKNSLLTPPLAKQMQMQDNVTLLSHIALHFLFSTLLLLLLLCNCLSLSTHISTSHSSASQCTDDDHHPVADQKYKNFHNNKSKMSSFQVMP